MRVEGENTDFCTIRYAAQRSGLAIKTWYQGGAGTNRVIRVRFGRSIRLLRSEVEKFINDRVAEAKYANQQPNK
jgi:predicted DNA-binding transcriptional regulator AlpA